MAAFNLDGTPVDQGPAAPPPPTVPVPTPLAPAEGAPNAPGAPKFSLDGTVNGGDVNASRIGISLEQPNQTPEMATRVLKMEKATRLPLPIIQENLEEIERQVDKKNFDPERFARENPKVAAWMAANPQHAALAREDRENLGVLERIVDSLGPKEQPDTTLKRGTFYAHAVDPNKPEGSIHVLSQQERLFELHTQRQVVLDRMRAYEAMVADPFKPVLPSQRRMLVPTAVGRERLAEIDAEIKRLSSLPTYGGQFGAEEAMGENLRTPIKLLPFVGSAPSVEQLTQVYAAAKRVEVGKGTDDDQNYLRNFLSVAQVRSKTDQTWGAHVVNIVSMLPGFAAEFALTGGVYSAAKEGAQKVVGKLLGESAETWAKKTIAGRITTGAVGALAQTPAAMPGRIVEGTIDNLVKQHNISQDDAGKVKVVIGPDGEDYGAAAGMAFLDSYIEMVTERSGGIMGELFGKIPGAQKLAAFKAAIVDRWFKTAPSATVDKLLNTIRTKGGWHGVLAEMGEERLGEILRAATGVDDKYRLKELYDKGGIPEVVKQLSAEYVAFLIPGLGANALRSVSGRYDPDKIIAAEKARQNEQVFKDLGDVSRETKMREHMPEKYQELVNELVRDGPVENLYVPVEFYQTHWEKQGMDPREASVAMGIEARYDEAVRTGGRLEIPTDVYLNRIAPTEHHSVFTRELSTAPDVMNAREAEEFMKKHGTDDEQVDRRRQEFDASVDRVRDDVRGQLEGLYPPDVADRYAGLYEARIRARAERLGVDPMELHQQKPLSIRRELPAVLREMRKMTDLDVQLDRLRAGEIPSEAKARGKSLLQFLKPFGLQDQGGELSAIDLQKVRGLVNKNGLTLDAAAEKAHEAGYISAYDMNELLDAIGEEAAGKPRYTASGGDRQAQESRERLNALDDYLGTLGVDIQSVDNSTIKKILESDGQTVSGAGPTAAYNAGYGQPEYRRQGPEGQDLHRTAAGTSPAQGWAESTVVRGTDGRPARIFRGSRNRVGPGHFQPESLGQASKKVAAALGVWFTRAKSEATEYAKKVQNGQVWEYFLDLRNPKVFTVDNLPAPGSRAEAMAIANKLRDQGHDGIVYDMRNVGGEIHFIPFTPEQVIFRPDAREYAQSKEAEPPRLSVLHNLSSENLEFSDKMGGLAVPSLGVVKEGMGLEGYGEITLIGRKELADPKQTEVFDADAYTSTFPRPEYKKVKSSVVQKIVNEFRPLSDKFDDAMTRGELWDNAVNNPKPWDTIGKFMRSNAAKAWFLSERGVEVKPIMSPIESRYGWSHADAWVNFVKNADHSAVNLDWDDPKRQQYMKDAGDAAIAAMREGAQEYKQAGFTKKDIDAIVKQGIENFINNDGSLGYSYLVTAIESAKKKGDKRVNRAKTERRLDKQLTGQEAEFKQWVEDKILPMYGEPFLTLGRKKVDYTLDNIVEVMTRGGTQAAEQTLTFGEGKARAVAAVRIKSFEEMRNRAEQITERGDVDKSREAAKKAMEAWRNKVVDYYGDRSSREFGRVWDGLDASMRAIAKWAKGKGLAAALHSEDFKGVPEHVIEQGIEAGKLFINAPVPYFEAKPERAVKLEEFAGAVIPADADENVKTILKKHGVPFKTYPKRFDEVARTLVVNKFREELQAKGADVLFQRDTTERGRIELRPDRIDIVMLQKADLTTFLHETAHLWFEELIDDATLKDSPQQLRDDLDAALEYLGLEVRSADGADAIRAAIQVEHHEKWARSVEAYLMEGKAPSAGIRELFARFRAWLVSVYKAITRLNVELTPEVRGVFDRLVATDAEIEAARADANVLPMFTTAADAGMSDVEFEAYRKTVEQASNSAQEELEQRLIREYTRERKKWWQDELAKVKTEVAGEVDAQRVYKTIKALQDKDGIKIDRKAVIDAPYAGRTVLKRLPRGVAAAKDGMHPDAAAELLGYKSGEELVMDLANARNRNQLVNAEADRIMRERHGDMMVDPELHDRARQAILNEDRTKVIQAEIRALHRKVREVKPFVKAQDKQQAVEERAGGAIYQALVPNVREIRNQAEQMLARKQVRELRPMQYFAAARKASRMAITAMKRKDYLMAGHQKGVELLNTELYRQAMKVQDVVNDSLDKLKYTFRADANLAKTRNIDMVNAARAILAYHGIGRSDKSPTAYLEALRKYDPEMYENMRAQVESAAEKPTNYRDMTVEEFMGMRDSVLALLHTSRRSKQMMIDGKLVERHEAVENLAARVGEFGKRDQAAGYKRAVTKWEKTQTGLLGARAITRRVEHWVDAMDGGAPDGVFRKYIWNPVTDAVNRYREAKKVVLQKYLELVKTIEKTMTHDKIEAPELDYTFNGKIELIHALLHTGNESNLSKLLRGRSWGEFREDGTLDISRWDRFVNRMIAEKTLTKADFDFTQGVWDLLDTLKPETQKAHHDMYGYYFDEVTATPFENEFGSYRGGYMPAIVDPDIVADAAIRKDREEILNGQNSFAFPTTGRGATMKRIEQYAKPLQLDMRTIPAHIDWAMRFAYIEPAVKDVGRVLINKEFRSALDQHDPSIARHMLMPWLQRTSNQAVSTPGMIPWLDKVARELRKRTGMQVMVANVINTLQQFTGLSIAMVKVKPHLLRNAFWQYVRHPGDTSEMIAEKSLFMRNRVFTAQTDITQMLDDLLLNPTKYEKARDFAERHGYFMQQGTQSFVDKIAWTGAYNQAIQQDMGETEAVRFADSVVRETQGSFAPEDISRVEAGSPFLRLFLMFYNYFNMQSNLLGTEFRNIATNDLGLRKGAGRALYVYIFGFMIPAFIGDGIIRALIAGEPDDDDDGYLDDYLSLFFMTQIRTAAAMIPAGGQIVMAGINVWNNKWYDDRITTSPAVSMLESAVRSPKSVYKAIAEDGSQKRAIQDVLTAIGLVSGLPVAPLSRPLGYLADIRQGKAEQPGNVIDLTRGLVSGRDPNRAK